MTGWLCWLAVFAKFGAPLLIVIQAAVPIYGAMWPWDIADARLSQYMGERPIMVGFFVRHREHFAAHQAA